MTKYEVNITFTEPLLASSPMDPKVYEAYIASRKRSDAEDRGDEVATLPAEEIEKIGTSVFHRDDKGLFLFDYHLRGFFKAAAEAMTGRAGKEPCEICSGTGKINTVGLKSFELCDVCKGKGTIATAGLAAYRSKIDKWVFAFPRRIYFENGNGPIKEPQGVLERPIRAMTAQGPRITLKRSETVNPGTHFTAQITVLPLGEREITETMIREWFSYGQYSGLGEWRTGSFGRFTFELKKL